MRAAKGGPEIVPCALAREACQSTRSSNCIMLVLPAQRTSPLEATVPFLSVLVGKDPKLSEG